MKSFFCTIVLGSIFFMGGGITLQHVAAERKAQHVVEYKIITPEEQAPTAADIAKAIELANAEAQPESGAPAGNLVPWRVYVAAADPIEDIAAASREAEKATMNVTCPASATITVDDHPTKQTGAKRVFYSPPLTHAGTYTFRAFVCTTQGCFNEVKKVHVNPGEEINVTLLGQVQATHECPCGSCSCTAGQCGHPACPTVGFSGIGDPRMMFNGMAGCASCGGGFGPPPTYFGGGGCGPSGCGGGGCGGGGCGGGRCR